MNSNTNTKTCDHKYECGCDKQYCAVCVEIHIEEDMDDDDKKRNSYMCEDESCRHYYAHRNDNCDCDGRDCGYCNPVVVAEVHNICSQCDCDLTDLTGCYAAEDELLCPECFDAVGKCSQCKGDIDDAFQIKLEEAKMLDGRGEVCCEKCWKEEWKQSGTCCRCWDNPDCDGKQMANGDIWCDDCYDEYGDECEECGECFELGTFNTVEMEDDGTQFCFCDGCRDGALADGRIKATDEETIFSITPCECCDAVGRENRKCATDNYIYCEECIVNFV